METSTKRRIAVAGTGYVGLSIATLLAQRNHVTAVDIVPEKVELINKRKSPIQDDYIEKYLSEKELDLTATLDAEAAYADADFIVIAAPTNYDSKKNFFDTSAVEDVIGRVLSVNSNGIMVIKSTIPVGYTESIRKKSRQKVFCLARNFFANQRRYTIIFIQAALLWVRTCRTKGWSRLRIPLPHFCRKEQSKKTSIRYIWDSRKPKR